MIILTIRTDKPEAEIGLYDDQKQLDYETWNGHRQLAETLHTKIRDLLARDNKTLKDLNGIVCFKGPGSFTGLRIGLTVANALAYSLEIPVVGEMDDDWVQKGISGIMNGQANRVVLPEYGAEVHITQPKH